MIFAAFAVLIPIFCYIDFVIYKKKLEKTLSEQPDYDKNRENYDLLYDRMCKKQALTEKEVAVVLVLFAIILGALYTNVMHGIQI
jgi:hypothetical protein